MQSGVHESLVGLRFVHGHGFLVPSPNLQIAHQTLVPSHTLSTLVATCKLVFMKAWWVHASIGDHVFLVPSLNLQITDQTLVPYHFLVTLVGACKLVFMR